MADRTDPLEALVADVLRSRKYRSVSPEFARRIGALELARHSSFRAAVKATRSKLHQVAGAYMGRRVDYAAHLAELRQVREVGSDAVWRRTCAQVMDLHASCRERLPILEDFYATTLGPLAPINSLLDVACGLNPLALSWMPLAEGAEYYACDIYHDMMAFVNEFLALAGVRGGAGVCDVIEGCPPHPVEVALVLKTIPCLEQVEREAGRRLLEAIDARHVLVSFPAHSLGGTRKGMVANYEARFRELVAGRGWSIERFQFSTELAFLIDKKPGS